VAHEPRSPRQHLDRLRHLPPLGCRRANTSHATYLLRTARIPIPDLTHFLESPRHPLHLRLSFLQILQTSQSEFVPRHWILDCFPDRFPIGLWQQRSTTALTMVLRHVLNAAPSLAILPGDHFWSHRPPSQTRIGQSSVLPPQKQLSDMRIKLWRLIATSVAPPPATL
jgi:hypothetical protein